MENYKEDKAYQRQLSLAAEEAIPEYGIVLNTMNSETNSFCSDTPIDFSDKADGTDIDPASRVRLVKRDLGHNQSSNELGINYTGLDVDICGLLRRDWFHAILSVPTTVSILTFLLVWTLVILLYAVLYREYDRLDPEMECGLGNKGQPINFGPAFAFSLETCTTVGYGLPSGTNAFFEETCPGLMFIIYAQMVMSMMFNAFLFAFFFARLARCEARGLQVCFANKAIFTQQKDDKGDTHWLFQTRVYDLNSTLPLVEAHIRCYLVSYHNKPDKPCYEPVHLQTMRLIDPCDEYGGVLYPSIPSTVSHHIDVNSPLNPCIQSCFHNNNNAKLSLGKSSEDSKTEEQSLSCPVCGSSFDKIANLQKHIRYRAIQERHAGLPVAGTHQDPDLVQEILLANPMSQGPPPPPKAPSFDKEDLYHFLQGKEIICVLEAIEPVVSGTFQAIQSYKSEDLIFGGGSYEPCMTIVPSVKGSVVVDMVKFHSILPNTSSN